ncbi:MAG: hypothetical protein CMO01_09145 [Thalassobius sp.]|nr:hypothetical protein [Thalassovita sp.]
MAKDSISKLRDRKKQKTVNIDSVSAALVKPFSGQKIIENPTLRAFIPPLKDEELYLLEQSIRAEGVREPLLLWVNPEGVHILVDGYNRFQIIRKLEEEGKVVKYGVKYLEFANFEDVKDWMLQNQLGRRNLTNEQRSYLRGLRYNREKSKHGGDRKSSGQNDPMTQGQRFSEYLSQEFGVGEKTIRRDAEFAKGIELIGESNPSLKMELLAGKVKIKKSTLQNLGKIEVTSIPVFNNSADVEGYLQKDINKADSDNSKSKSINSSTDIEKLFKKAKNSLDSAYSSREAKDITGLIKVLEELKSLL